MKGEKTMQQTIREKLRDSELSRRDDDAKTTKFDEPVSIERRGKTIVVPKEMRPERAVEWVKRWAEAEQQVVSVSETIDGVPIDAALALNRAVQHEFGVSELKNGFWGTPPPFISVPTSHRGENVDVYVGTMSFPGFEDATIGVSADNDNLRLSIGGRVRQKDMPLLKQLIETARRFLREQSLYKGKAFSVDLEEKNEDEDQGMVLPTFWNVEEEKPFIVSADVEALIQATLWTPMTMLDMCKSIGTPIKRGILLYGTFGTGKTLLAYNTARVAVRSGFTFVYMKDVNSLSKGIEFASRHYLPAVLFCEDTEKAFEDPSKITQIQNTMDGIDSKSRDLIVVLTSNYVEQLPPGIMRPGRLDAIIALTAPDAEAGVRLVKLYAGDLLDSDSDLKEIGRTVQDNIPAAIREIVERAKLFALSRTGSVDFKIDHRDIAMSAFGMQQHMRLLRSGNVGMLSPVEMFGSAIGREIGDAVRDGVAEAVSGKIGDEVKARSAKKGVQ